VTVTVTDDRYGAGPKAVHFRLDGGPEQVIAATGDPGTAAVPIPEGNHTLVYWGEDGAGNQESPHQVVPVQVDTTAPRLSITSDQGFSSYELSDKATVTVMASDATSGLAVDPSRSYAAISTARPGRFTLGIAATDHCANSTSASFTYTVIANPIFARTVNLEPLTGTVRVKSQGSAGSATARAAISRGFVVLAGARQVPLGSIVDATDGEVRVTTATTGHGRIQTGAFAGGRFKIVQARGARGLAELRLIDAATPRACTTTARVLGLLRARAQGSFAARGRYASATLTAGASAWSVIDRCNGTLTQVARGSVSVRDFARHQSITIRAGHSYLARP
jgi:hypothetical protein